MILLLICFVSLFFVSFRMVSLPIDFVSHPKIPVSLRSETSKTGGSVSLFCEKKFRYVSLQFRFEAKFGDTLIRTLKQLHIKTNFQQAVLWETRRNKVKKTVHRLKNATKCDIFFAAKQKSQQNFALNQTSCRLTKLICLI